jgi:archaellum component FlaC
MNADLKSQEISEIKEQLARLEKLISDMSPNVSLAVAKLSTLAKTLENVTRKFAQIPFSQI